ncbi:MAG: DUF386 domain-containing protein [candidate division WS1 bacterium]|nr:DUF386 domain-containing protein [candidate division WS1 bacterium]
MIIAKLADSERYAGILPSLAEAFRWLRETEPGALPPGRQEIDGDRVWANVIQAPAKSCEEARLEVHRRHLDVQYLLSGEESFGWRPVGECTEAAGEFDEAADVGFFTDDPLAWYLFPPESFALFFPEDAHAPLVGQGEIRKVVVKVRM